VAWRSIYLLPLYICVVLQQEEGRSHWLYYCPELSYALDDDEKGSTGLTPTGFVASMMRLEYDRE
jgi:hypothetical protein